MTDTLTLIAARRREIEAEIAKLTAEINALRAELPDLDAAERVLGRLTGAPGIAGGASAAATQPEADAGKPPNTPTVPEMIREALQDAAARGLKGLEPKEMTDYIAKRWWPNVPGVAVSPIAWRMWHRRELGKDGPVYSLPRNTEAADHAPDKASAASMSNQH